MSYTSKVINKAKRDGIHVKEIVNSAVRVSSKPFEQNLVCLAPDKYGFCFNKGPLNAIDAATWYSSNPFSAAVGASCFGGDMGFCNEADDGYVLTDPKLSVYKSQSNVSLDNLAQSQVYLDPYATPLTTKKALASDHDVVLGPYKYMLSVKSATVGSKVHYEIYECSCRYDITKYLTSTKIYTDGTYMNNDGMAPIQQDVDMSNSTKYQQMFTDWCSVYAHCVGSLYDSSSNANQVSLDAPWERSNIFFTDRNTMIQSMNACKVPGVRLTAFHNLMQLIKIDKTHKGSLMPGQVEYIKLSASPRKYNFYKDSIGVDNFARAGEKVFFIRVWGSVGHERQNQLYSGLNTTPIGNQNVYNSSSYATAPGGQATWTGGAFYAQYQSRPNINLMAAHVDVSCVKVLHGWRVPTHPKSFASRKIFQDDAGYGLLKNTPTLAAEEEGQYTQSNVSTVALVDTFPSFYSASSAQADQ